MEYNFVQNPPKHHTLTVDMSVPSKKNMASFAVPVYQSIYRMEKGGHQTLTI